MASAGAQRSLTVQLDNSALRALSQSGYSLQIVHGVASHHTQAAFNMVWKSLSLAPNLTVSWVPVYGLNWTTQLPAPGMSVEVESQWTQCNIGQVFDIDQYGFFVASTIAPDTTAMKVGKNNYTSPEDDGGIHIVVGIQDPVSKTFSPIFVDPEEIFPHFAGGTWQPVEKLQWWYEAGELAGTTVLLGDSPESPIETGDFSVPDPQLGTLKKQSSYNITKGIWTTTAIA